MAEARSPLFGQDSLSPSHMGLMPLTGPTSPITPNTALVSFNFLTQVPIDEFIHQENSKASKMSARLRNTASMKIQSELNRKIREAE